MIHLNFVSGIAGAGKSFASLETTAHRAKRGDWILYVVPTVALAQQAAATLRSFGSGIEPEIIHHGVVPVVAPAVLHALGLRPASGRILLITWSAFMSMPFFPAKG